MLTLVLQAMERRSVGVCVSKENFFYEVFNYYCV